MAGNAGKNPTTSQTESHAKKPDPEASKIAIFLPKPPSEPRSCDINKSVNCPHSKVLETAKTVFLVEEEHQVVKVVSGGEGV